MRLKLMILCGFVASVLAVGCGPAPTTKPTGSTTPTTKKEDTTPTTKKEEPKTPPKEEPKTPPKEEPKTPPKEESKKEGTVIPPVKKDEPKNK